MGWTLDENLMCITTLAQVYIFDFFGNLKQSVGFIEKVRDAGILFIKTWETGLGLISNDLETWVIQDIDNPVCEKYSKIVVNEIPYCMELLIQDDYNSPELLIGPKQGNILLNSIDKVKVMETRFGPFKKISCSPSGNYLALFNSQGNLLVTTSDLVKNITEFNTKSQVPPTQLVWCGEDSICCYWSPEDLNSDSSLLLMIGPTGYQKFPFEGAIHLISEYDGVRIITNETCEFLQRVPSQLVEIFKIGSLEPSAKLFDCFTEFEESTSIQMNLINSMRNNLPRAIKTCLEAAAFEFDLKYQRKLLSAASFGKSFLKYYDQKIFVSISQIIRVMNAVRDQNIGIPITYTQYNKLKPIRLIRRLLRRNLHETGFNICKFLGMKVSIVIEDWSISKIKSQSEDRDIFDTVMQKLQLSQEFSLAKLAGVAHENGKKKLALAFLDNEKNAGDQVPILLKMNEFRKALQKAIESGESEMIYLVLVDIRKKMDPKDMFQLIIDPQFDVAKNLLISYSKEQDIEFLKIFLQSINSQQEAASMYILESTSVNDINQKRRLLKQAKDLLSQKKECYYDAQFIGNQIELYNHQSEFDINNIQKKYSGLSISEMIEMATFEREDKKGEFIRSQYNVPDHRYWRIKIKVYGKMQAWEDLDKFSKIKKSPIGYGPFCEVCLEQNNQTEALKYVGRITELRDRVEYCCALGLWKEAIEAAASKKDQRLLVYIGNKTKDPTIKGQVGSLLKKF